ncbi:MAG TPA: DinB family protein [Bryobacteraceae bacterium]|jgi:uncharacterized damage-inducible protein DinB|nr:DinB family protein [Bryobacteraceae bacterium]
MTNESAVARRDFLLSELRTEFATTCKVIAAVPAKTSNYKPSEKCMSGHELARHIALAEVFFLRGVIDGKFDWKEVDLADPAAVLAYYKSEVPALFDQVAAMPGEKLAAPIEFHSWTLPAVKYLSIDLKHGIHHRGQLSSYLRPMGAKVPSIYGPSADDAADAAAS